jgi:hypothetical protein
MDRRDRMRTAPTVAECFVKVQTGEMSETDAQNEVACLEIEEAFRSEQLMGNTFTYEPAFRVFTWALDWAFDEATNDDEIPLAVQMRMWEEDEMRKMQEEGIRSPFTQWRTRASIRRRVSCSRVLEDEGSAEAVDGVDIVPERMETTDSKYPKCPISRRERGNPSAEFAMRASVDRRRRRSLRGAA